MWVWQIEARENYDVEEGSKWLAPILKGEVDSEAGNACATMLSAIGNACTSVLPAAKNACTSMLSAAGNACASVLSATGNAYASVYTPCAAAAPIT